MYLILMKRGSMFKDATGEVEDCSISRLNDRGVLVWSSLLPLRLLYRFPFMKKKSSKFTTSLFRHGMKIELG